MKNPEVACLLLQAEVATVIPDYFFRSASLTSLDLSAESVVTRIGNYFLGNCTSLTSINLSGLIHVTHIGQCFLSGCSALCSLDLSPLSNVTQIKYCFLNGCRSLRTLDLSPLSRVTHMDTRYSMSRCTSLESIYLTGCSDVASSAVREELGHLVVESVRNAAETNHLKNPASD